MNKKNNFNFFENVMLIYKNKFSLLIYFLFSFLFFFILIIVIQINNKNTIKTDKVLAFTLSNPAGILGVDNFYYQSLIYNNFNSKIDNFSRSNITQILNSIYSDAYSINVTNFFDFTRLTLSYKSYLKDFINFTDIHNKVQKIKIVDDFFELKNQIDINLDKHENTIKNIYIFVDSYTINQKKLDTINNYFQLVEKIYFNYIKITLNNNFNKINELILNELRLNKDILKQQYEITLKKDKILKELIKSNTNRSNPDYNDIRLLIENELESFEIQAIENKLFKLNTSIDNLKFEKNFKIPVNYLEITNHNVSKKEIKDENTREILLSTISYNTIFLSIILAISLSLIILFTRINYKLYMNNI